MRRNLSCRLIVSFIWRHRGSRDSQAACGSIRAAMSACGTFGLAMMAASSTIGAASASRQAVPVEEATATESDLEGARQSGDLHFQRRHVWKIITRLTEVPENQSVPRFESWYGEEQVFGDTGAQHLPTGIRGFSRSSSAALPRSDSASQSADAPVLTYTLYNEAAYDHIRQHHLYKLSELERLKTSGAADLTTPGNRSVPAFPAEAMVLKTVWWPVAPHGTTPLPVWDPGHNPPQRTGNGYLTWRRVVAVDPSENTDSTEAIPSVNFVGGSFANVRKVKLKEFYHLKVDALLAERAMRDPDTKKAALIALGRPIKDGDYLLLVAANLATKEINDWVWATFWWHDRANQGPFSADRPPTLKGEWRNYLVQVALDSNKPIAPDSGPHICFDPWLEGRFPDTGNGGGTISNCMTCHRRASFPALSFLPVTRGAPDQLRDPAFAPGRLRTGFLWSLSMHARE
jgi:hypothetical protein